MEIIKEMLKSQDKKNSRLYFKGFKVLVYHCYIRQNGEKDAKYHLTLPLQAMRAEYRPHFVIDVSRLRGNPNVVQTLFIADMSVEKMGFGRNNL